ncbi:MAG: hypothetical protein EA379_11220 [Phycisphaerales bacterium]|nr:MAG: hypothetical protein EA379_11220 [Phycisphaerales bacterium]
MRVLLIADRSFAARERSMLDRLEIGLADEGARIVRLSPENESHDNERSLSARLHYHDKGGALVELTRLRPLLRDLADLNMPAPEGVDASRPIDIIHAWGDGCWDLATDLAQETGAALAMDVWSLDALAVARRSAADRPGARASEGVAPTWFAPDAAMHAEIQRQMPSAASRLTPWGVHLGEERTPLSRLPDSFSIVITGTGRDASACTQALRAVGALGAEFPQMLVFLDAAIIRRRHAVWREAQSLGLLDRLSVLEDVEGRRELVVQADILLQPEGPAEHRTLPLDAMANSMIVIAQADPAISALVHNETALIVDSRSQGAWQSALRSVLEHPENGVALAQSARSFIAHERLASAHVRSVLSAYEWMMGARPIAFGDSQSGKVH